MELKGLRDKIVHLIINYHCNETVAANKILDLFKDSVIDLEKELEVTDKLLAERQRVLDAIPECPTHGHCIPHAIEWIEARVWLEAGWIEEIEEIQDPKYTESDMHAAFIGGMELAEAIKSNRLEKPTFRKWIKGFG